MQASLFLLVLLVLGIFAKNQSLIIAIVVLLVLKWTGMGDRLFPYIDAKGIHWGVIVITIAVLVPIATGDIGFKQLYDTLKLPSAWIALASGMAVALVAVYGIDLLDNEPQMTTALVFGTILAVAFFKAVPVGPLIGAGIAYLAMKVVQVIMSIGSS
jgi:uncharacterized membrane protein (DUF441 family)